MSAVVAETPTLDISETTHVPFGRLVRLEARKLADTRAGFWLLFVTGLLIGLAMAITLLVVLLNDDVEITANTFSQIMAVPLSLLVPVLAITSVTSEWSQRTGLVSFTLEPHRMRVILAKLVTVVALSLATIALAVVLGAIGNVLYGLMSGKDVVWDIDPSIFAWVIAQQLLFFVMAFAFGMLILSTPGAIAIYYIVALLLPLMVYGALFAIFEWARDIIPWIDLSYALAPYLRPEDPTLAAPSATTLAQVIVTTLVWVVLPLALGARRVARAELK
jgi:ABC-2 type transport system permease protein